MTQSLTFFVVSSLWELYVYKLCDEYCAVCCVYTAYVCACVSIFVHWTHTQASIDSFFYFLCRIPFPYFINASQTGYVIMYIQATHRHKGVNIIFFAWYLCVVNTLIHFIYHAFTLVAIYISKWNTRRGVKTYFILNRHSYFYFYPKNFKKCSKFNTFFLYLYSGDRTEIYRLMSWKNTTSTTQNYDYFPLFSV